jgi:hypothetical protein
MRILIPTNLMGIMTSIKIFISIAVVLFFASCAEQGDGKVSSDMIHFAATASENAEEYKGPQIQFDSSTFDFGILAVGQTVKHTFQFLNAGKSDLIITDVHPSCGCTALKDWPKEPIAPGASGTISIEYKASAETGDVNKSIAIATNAEPKDYKLFVKGKVVGVGVKQEEAKGKMHMERTR